MQPGGRCGHRTATFRKHGLISRLIELVRRAGDVGRQRHLTARIEHVVDHALEFEPVQIAAPLDHGYRLAVRLEQHAAARFQRFADANLTQRAPLALDPFDQQLRRAARILLAMQPRTDHARVVQHQQIVRQQQIGKRVKPTMLDRTARGSITIRRLSVRLGNGVCAIRRSGST